MEKFHGPSAMEEEGERNAILIDSVKSFLHNLASELGRVCNTCDKKIKNKFI